MSMLDALAEFSESASDVGGWCRPDPVRPTGPPQAVQKAPEADGDWEPETRRRRLREERRRSNHDLVALLDEWMAEEDPEQAEQEWAEIKEGLDRHPVRFREGFCDGEKG